MFEADAVERIRKLDVHAEVVGVELELVSRLETLVLVHLHRLVVPGHGTGVTLRDHARHMLFRLGLEPYREAGREEELIGSRLRDDAAARGDHGALVFFEHPLEAAPLVAPVAGLPVKEKDLRETGARIALDLAVELDKGRAQRLGELRTERGLARTAQSDERDPLHAFVARAAVIADKL